MAKTFEEINKELEAISAEPIELDDSTLDQIKTRQVDPLSKLCEIYCPVRGILKAASALIPGKVGRAIKSIVSVLDAICDCTE